MEIITSREFFKEKILKDLLSLQKEKNMLVLKIKRPDNHSKLSGLHKLTQTNSNIHQ